MANENAQNQAQNETITLTKADFESLKKTIADEAKSVMEGLKDVVESQAKTIEQLKVELKTASERAENVASAVNGKYVRPATISSGMWTYFTFPVRILYKQAGTNGVVNDKEITVDITMPKPCGRLNSVKSELKNRVVPRIMKEKNITNYIVSDVLYDESKVKSEEKKVSFVGKKPVDLNLQECEDFAIIYEGLQIPVNADLAITIQKVASEWAYILHDIDYGKPYTENGRVVDKRQMTLELVAYKGVRQEYPDLEAMTPSAFRELAENVKKDE